MTIISNQSIEAEQSVLGALMIDAESNRTVIEQLTDEHFASDSHRSIISAILYLYEKRQSIDMLTVDDYLVNIGAPTGCDIGQLSNLCEETQGITSGKVWGYYQILIDRMQRRRVLAAAQSMVVNTQNIIEIDEVIEASQSVLTSLFSEQGSETEEIRTVAGRVIETIDEQYHRAGDDLVGITSGFAEIDKMTMGFQPGLHIIAGRPKMGKTTIGMNLCENAALHGIASGIFSLEMPPEMLTKKCLASLGGISYDRLRNPKLMQDEDFVKIAHAATLIDKMPIQFFGGMQAGIAKVKSGIRAWHRKTSNAKIVMIDYLQLMEHRGNGNLTDMIGETTRQLKLLAEELGVVIFLLSQLSRDVDKRPDKRPVASDLRSSGNIEQDADSIWFVYRDEVYNDDSEYKGICELICRAARHFEGGTVMLASQLHYQRFQNLQSDWTAPQQHKSYTKGAGL